MCGVSSYTHANFSTANKNKCFWNLWSGLGFRINLLISLELNKQHQAWLKTTCTNGSHSSIYGCIVYYMECVNSQLASTNVPTFGQRSPPVFIYHHHSFYSLQQITQRHRSDKYTHMQRNNVSCCSSHRHTQDVPVWFNKCFSQTFFFSHLFGSVS